MKQIYAHYSTLPVSGSGGSFVPSSPTSPKSSPKRDGSAAAEDIFYLNQGNIDVLMLRFRLQTWFVVVVVVVGGGMFTHSMRTLVL